MPKLIIQREGVSDRGADLGPTNSIGRLKGCTVQLEDPQISRVHAFINLVDGRYMLKDQGSMNGTYLNDRKLESGEEVVLNHADELRIQSFTLKLDLEVESKSSLSDLKDTRFHAPLVDLNKPPPPSILLSHLLDKRSDLTVWSGGEITLRVADIIDESSDTKTFRLVGKEDVLFSYKPGQFVTVSLDIDGKVVKRSYSMSSSPSRPHTMELTIKRVPGGLVSNWMADHTCLGDEIKVRGPAGKFSCFNFPSRKMLCLAGGSGITPIMSMLRWIVDTTADVDVILLYSGRSPGDFIFRKELETISARHSGLRVIFTVTSRWNGTECWTGLTGRITKGMISLVASDLIERHVFLCGPKPFSEAIRDELKELDYPIANLHKESFGEGRVAKGTKVARRTVPKVPVVKDPVTEDGAKSGSGHSLEKTGQGPVTPKEAPEAAPKVEVKEDVSPSATEHKILFTDSEIEAVAKEGEFLLDVAESQGVEINYACREGSCGSCMTKLLSGTVSMEENELSDEDKAMGMIFTCVARATSDVSLEA